MSLVICFNNKDPEPWRKELSAQLKDTTIEVYPNVKDPAAVTFALCWKPDKNTLDQFPNLAVAQSVGASVEHITQSQNLPVNCQITRIVDPQLSDDMFEFILAGIMTYMKEFATYQLNEPAALWQPKSYKRINNTTIGVLGLGKIGKHVSAKLAQVGFKVKAWSNSEKLIENVNCFHGENNLKQVLNAADILLNILPLTAATENILNRNNLLALNKGAYIINVGRGEHLVEADLINLIDEGHLNGAMLDVFRTEPLPAQHPFWQHEKVRVTPHIAAITNIATAVENVVTNYKNHLNGTALINTISLKKGY